MPSVSFLLSQRLTGAYAATVFLKTLYRFEGHFRLELRRAITPARFHRFASDPVEQAFKITYKKCALEANAPTSGSLTFTESSSKSSVKIAVLKKGMPANATDGPGVMYLSAGAIDTVSVTGDMGKFFTGAPIGTLSVTGSLKSLSTKNAAIRTISAEQLGTVKMTTLANATATPAFYARTSIFSGSGAMAMKASVSGAVVEQFFTDQPVKYLKVATKAYRDKATKEKRVSLGGIIGFPSDPTAMRVLCGNLSKIDGQGGVAGVFIAGFTDGAPNYSGTIKKIQSKYGTIQGVVHAAGDPKIVGDATGLAIVTE